MLDMRDTERKLYKSATHLGYSKIAYFDTLNQLKGIKGDWCQADYIMGPLLRGRRCWIRRTVKQEALFE